MDTSWGKMYCKTWTGSMVGAGSHSFAVLAYAVAHAKPPNGHVELNPELLSYLMGDSVVHMQQAIDYLCKPDARSRSKEEDGRRLIPVGGFEYRMVTFLKHRDGFIQDDLKAYWRNKKKAQRAASHHVFLNVQDSPGTCPHTEAEADTEKIKIASKGSALSKSGRESRNGRAQISEVGRYLLSLCLKYFGAEEMKRQEPHWRKRATEEPDKLERVLGEIKRYIVEQVPFTKSPAACAEDLWKRFE